MTNLEHSKKIGVIALVPDNWHGVWTSRHHVLARLAKHFEVIWIEPADNWRDYWVARLSKIIIQGNKPEEFGLTVYNPGRWMPEIYWPKHLGDWIRKLRVLRVCKLLNQRGCTHIVLYLWRPEFNWVLNVIKADLTCYHIDDEYTFSKVDLPNQPREIALINQVDQVIIHSRKLMEKKGNINPHTMHVPNGVDYHAFATPAQEPTDMVSIPRPRMGYVGVIKAQLNLELLCQLAEKRPEWSFVLVGPQGYLGEKAACFQKLASLPNVYLLGNRQLAELPAYMQAMNVCMMCYEVCDYTHFIYPLKLNEFLATGRPVVSSPIDSVLPLRHLVKIAENLREWELALAEELSAETNAPAAIKARQRQSELYDWNRLVHLIAEQIYRRIEGNACS